jgi:hypothetical protein
VSLLVVPDVELLAVTFFRSQPEVAALLGDRVYSALPAHPEWPAARVVRWGGWPLVSTPLVLDEGWCQVDIWGGPKSVAYRVATVMRAVTERLKTEVAHVSSRRLGSLLDSPDTSYEPAKPHYRFDLSIITRAVLDNYQAGRDPGPSEP